MARLQYDERIDGWHLLSGRWLHYEPLLMIDGYDLDDEADDWHGGDDELLVQLSVALVEASRVVADDDEYERVYRRGDKHQSIAYWEARYEHNGGNRVKGRQCWKRQARRRERHVVTSLLRCYE